MGAGGWEGLVLVERSVGGRPENREQQISVLSLFVFTVYVCLPARLYGCHLSAEPIGARRGRIPWSWSCRQLSAAMWVMGPEPRFSVRAAYTFSLCALRPRVGF